MTVKTATVTFTNGTAVLLSALFTSDTHCTRLYVEPDSANTHVCYVGDSAMALGTSTVDHVIKRVAKPTAADAVLDNFESLSSAEVNTIQLAQYSFDGTTSEKARVTIWVA